MTKRQFNKLKVGDEVSLNGLCRMDVGTICKVVYICDDCMWVTPIKGTLKAEHSFGDFNEISYKAANIIQKKQALSL